MTPFDLTPAHKDRLAALAQETGKSIPTLLAEALDGLQDRVRSVARGTAGWRKALGGVPREKRFYISYPPTRERAGRGRAVDDEALADVRGGGIGFRALLREILVLVEGLDAHGRGAGPHPLL